jgi:hypothetical protein
VKRAAANTAGEALQELRKLVSAGKRAASAPPSKVVRPLQDGVTTSVSFALIGLKSSPPAKSQVVLCFLTVGDPSAKEAEGARRKTDLRIAVGTAATPNS